MINPLIENFDGSGSSISIGAVKHDDVTYFKSSIYSDWQYVSGVDEIVADGNDAVKMSVTGDYITLTGIEAGGVVAITDLAGRNILSLATSDNSLQINTSDFNPGCYIIFYSNESVNLGEKVFISK